MERSYEGMSRWHTLRKRAKNSYQWSSADSVDQEPRDEGCDEEPSLEEARHESRHVAAEPDAFLKQSSAVVCLLLHVISEVMNVSD